MLEKKQKFRIGCFPVLFLIVVCCILAYSLYSKHNEVSEEDPIIEEQSIKYFPPKLTENNDIIFEKSIRWKDFFNREQKIQFSTSQSEYFKTVAFHRNVVRNINIHQLYIELLEFDNHKLNSVLDKLCNRANNENMNAIEFAGLICSFIQEIPYVLVHELSCKEAEANDAFESEWHRKNKPCIPNVPGGVQSPYEFMHNLKGDCDTRSLLAFTLLSKVDIPCSLWISDKYGHSVLGVGLPIGQGFYKEINGVKHYAIELTSKGFGLGQISPEQQVESNWIVDWWTSKN